MMIHTPRLPKHILPSKYSDQLAHAVIQCRTVKPMRKTKYSTQFELFEQKGTFNGIDTFGLTDYQNMAIPSELLAHYESLSIYHRRDTNALLNKLVEEKKIGKCVANDRRSEAVYRVENLNMNVDYLVSGATYVPIEATMKYVREQSNSQQYCSFTTPSDEPNRTVKRFRPIWPLHLYPCQKMDVYGTRFPNVPNWSPKKISDADSMDNPTSMALWTTLAMLTHVEIIWDCVSKVELCTSNWEGWVLNFLSRNSFPSQSLSYQNRSDPFKPSQCKSALQVYKKFDANFMSQFKVIFARARERIFIVDCELGENNQDHLDESVNNGHGVLIYQGFQHSDNTPLPEIKIVGSSKFELRFVSVTFEHQVTRRRQNRTVWDGFLYARHGGNLHKKWWVFFEIR